MAKEVLAIPEEHLAEVIYVIECGINETLGVVSDEVTTQLEKWCAEESRYLDSFYRDSQ